MSCDVIVCTLRNLEKNRESFELWMNHHGKTYGTKEEIATRYRIWLSKFKKVEEHNARFDMGLETFTLGMEGQHADKTNEEYRNLILGFRKRSGASGAIETFDWTEFRTSLNLGLGSIMV